MTTQKGDRVELNYMSDPHPVPPGTKGTVTFVDGTGTVHVRWDNGRSLGLIPSEEEWRAVTDTTKTKETQR